MKHNKETYQSGDVVRYYEKYQSLQKAEARLMQLIGDKLSGMDMLDIGIGAGRTTLHFAHRVKSYTGVDYASGMIDACLRKFGDKLPAATFQQADVRDLSRFTDNSFDLVLFSFNGLDYILPEERETALREIYRVSRPGAWFFFSTHNLISLLNFRAFEFRLNLPAAIRRYFEVKKIKRINRVQFGQARHKDVVTINDGAHNFRLETCYYRPSYQVKLLETCGFSDILLFDTQGENADPAKEHETSNDKWIYYLARKR